MSITNRLTLLFLTTILVILTGFSIGLFVIASAYLHQQAEESLESALNTLMATVEIKPDVVEFEFHERRLLVGPRSVADQLYWAVFDAKKNILAESPHEFQREQIVETLRNHLGASGGRSTIVVHGESWLTETRAIVPTVPRQTESRLRERDDEVNHEKLLLTAAISLVPTYSTLRELAITLAVLTSLILTVVALIARIIIRRGLRPIHEMAESVGLIDSSTLGNRLVVPKTGDDVERLYRSFNELLSRLEESFEKQRRFTRDASHQFRTPLAVILGQVEVALRRDRTADEYRGTMKLVQQRIVHLTKLIESLLFLARTENDSRTLDRNQIDLNELVNETVQEFSKRGRRFELLLIPGNRTIVLSHGVLLRELLYIIIENACAYSEAATTISVRVVRRDDEVSIEVEDRGEGMDANELSRVRQPFVRLPDALGRHRDGLGLGLSIADRICDLLDLKLRIRSVKGIGTVVEVAIGRDGLNFEGPPES